MKNKLLTNYQKQEELNEQIDRLCNMIIDDYLAKNIDFGSATFGTQNIGTLTNQTAGSNIETYGHFGSC